MSDFDKPNKDVVYAQPRAFEFTYYLSDCVQDSHEYHELLQLLDTASENDLIRLVINNYGGEVGSTVQLVDHIRSSKATVVGLISGNAFSAAGVIWMACDIQEFSEHCMLMIHCAVGGSSGKYSDIEKYIKVANKRTRKLYADIFEGFLTEEELEAVARGEELWILDDELHERLSKRDEIFAAKHKESQTKAFDLEDLYEEVLTREQLLKLTKSQLAQYVLGEISVDVDDNGKLIITELDNSVPE
jgi:ATP-dependent protease ClpP protease subunit